ncbi:hypothetical protein SLE2022_223350 [Rubroshorea leprosula]
MELTSVFSVFAFFVFVFFLFHSLFNFFSPNRGKFPFPPGLTGLPYIGETFQLYSQNANVFFASKQKGHGSLFETHIVDCPFVMISRSTYPPSVYPPPPGGYPPPPGGYPPSPQGYPPHGYAPPQGYPPSGYRAGAYPSSPGGYPPPPQGYPPHGYAPPQGYPPAGYRPGAYPPAGYPDASQSGHGGVEAMNAGGAAAAAAAYWAHHFAHGGLHPMGSSSSSMVGGSGMVGSSSMVGNSSMENLSAESMECLARNSSSGSEMLSDS